MAKKKKRIQLPDPMPRLDKFGREVPDPEPIAIPVKIKRLINDTDRMREIIRSEQIRHQLEQEGISPESFEEADDFDVDEEYDPSSPYELVLDGELDGEVSTREQRGKRTSADSEGGTGERDSSEGEGVQPAGEGDTGQKKDAPKGK